MNTTKIIEHVSVERYKKIISGHKIRVSYHALDHLSDAQRKIFKEEELIFTLTKESPRGVGLQKNGRYAAFFRRKENYLRIIFEIKLKKLEIITFMNTENMPNLKRLRK